MRAHRRHHSTRQTEPGQIQFGDDDISSSAHLDVDWESKIFLYYFYQSVSMHMPAFIGLTPACHVGVHWTRNMHTGKVGRALTSLKLGNARSLFMGVNMSLTPQLSIGILLHMHQFVCFCSLYECMRFEQHSMVVETNICHSHRQHSWLSASEFLWPGRQYTQHS